MICQHLYWPGILEAVYKEVTGCDICQLTKRPTKIYGKLPANLAEETPQKKLCEDMVGLYKICRN